MSSQLIAEIANHQAFSIKTKFCHLIRSRKEKRMLEKGLGRMHLELEVDHFIRTQMQVRIALKTLFTKLERFLLRNQKVFVLNSSSSDRT